MTMADLLAVSPTCVCVCVTAAIRPPAPLHYPKCRAEDVGSSSVSLPSLCSFPRFYHTSICSSSWSSHFPLHNCLPSHLLVSSTLISSRSAILLISAHLCIFPHLPSDSYLCYLAASRLSQFSPLSAPLVVFPVFLHRFLVFISLPRLSSFPLLRISGCSPRIQLPRT